jgi:trk system potassium uptake protein TrkA
MVRLLQFEQGHVSLHEVTLADRSPAVGRTLRDLNLPMDSAVVGIVREGHVVRPTDDTVLAVGDEVLVIVPDTSEEQVRKELVAAADERQGP